MNNKHSLWEKLEDPDRDFPFYNGIPTRLSMCQWLWLMIAVAVGLAILVIPMPLRNSGLTTLIPATLFLMIPLTCLYLFSGGKLNGLFYQLKPRDFCTMLIIATLNLIVTLCIGLIVSAVWGTDSNSVIAGLGEQTGNELVLFYSRTFIQIIGEEFLTILPFLALLTLFIRRFNYSRGQAISAAWILSAVLFGLVHLPTYNWNLIQCLLVIGSARLILTIAYIKTKNLWICSGAHIINDWTLFTMAIAMSIAI